MTVELHTVPYSAYNVVWCEITLGDEFKADSSNPFLRGVLKRATQTLHKGINFFVSIKPSNCRSQTLHAMEKIAHQQLPMPKQQTPPPRNISRYRSPSIKIRYVSPDVHGDDPALQLKYAEATHRMFNRIIHHRNSLPITHYTNQVPPAPSGHEHSSNDEVNDTVQSSHQNDDDEIFEMDL